MNVANVQSETTAQSEIVKFTVASKYYKTRNYNGKTLVNSYAILRRIGTSFDVLETITENDGNILRYINRYSPTIINGIQQFFSIGLSANAPTVEPKNNDLAEIVQFEVLYMDDSYSDMPGDNSQPEQDIPEAHSPKEPPAPMKAESGDCTQNCVLMEQIACNY